MISTYKAIPHGAATNGSKSMAVNKERRRTESNVFDRPVKRSITRPILITYKKIVQVDSLTNKTYH